MLSAHVVHLALLGSNVLLDRFFLLGDYISYNTLFFLLLPVLSLSYWDGMGCDEGM